jgi:hypothetical protein
MTMNATTARMTTAEKSANLTRIAREHAEHALTHYAYVNGWSLEDREFDAELKLMADGIRGHLVAMHARRVAPEKRIGAYRVAEVLP